MKCFMCKHGQTEPELVTVHFDKKETCVIVKNVPAEVCQTCGERYFDENTTGKLLEISNAAVQRGTEVEIIRYAA